MELRATRWTVSALGLVTALAGHAGAQEAVPDAGRSTAMGEVVVTAEKREQSVQDVPVSITAITAEQRENMGIVTITDIANFTPGFTYGPGDRPSIRGVGRLSNNLAVENSVATYADGAWTNSVAEAGKDALFVERSEILRGPQGTLYGRNSIGGAINVISKRPTDEFEAEARMTFYNEGGLTRQASVSGPITDNLRYRVAISAPRNDGYFHNVANGQSVGATDLWYGEAQIEWDILDNLQLWAVWRSSEWDDTALYGGYGLGTYVTNRQYGVGALGPSPTFGYSQTGLTQVGTVTQNPQLTDHRAVNEDTIPHRTLDDTNIYGLHLDWDLGDVAVRYIYGGQEYVYHQTTDFDGTPVTSYLNAFGPYGGVETRATIFPSYVLEYEEDKSWYSHELTIASQGDGPVQWIAGLYQFHDEYDQPVSVDMPNQPQVGAPTYNYFCSGALGSVSVGPIPGPVDDFVCLGGGGPYFFPWGGTAAGGGPIPLAPANPQRSVFFATHAANNYSYAVFGQVDWDVSDQWQLTLGLRYTEDEKRIREQTRLVCFGNLDFGCTPANSVGYAGYVSQANDVTTRFNSGFLPGGVLAPGVVTAPFTDLVTGRRVRDLAGKWSATTGTTGVQFRPHDDQLLYLRYSRGYKAGSFNAGNVIPDPTADPEFIDAYELGWKGGIGSRFTIESSAFFYNWHDMQVPLTVVQAGASREDLINLAEVEIYGAEFESHWEPVDNLYMLLSYAYLHTEIKEGCCFTSPVDPAAVLPGASRVAFDAVSGSWSQDLAGNPLPQSPEHRVTFNASYMWNFDAGTLIPSLTYIWRDEAYNGIFETPQTVAPAWDQVDLRLTYRTSDDRATIIGFVRNALDEEQYTAAGVNRVITGPGGALPFFVTAPSRLDRTYGIAPPRTYGVEVHFRFN